MSLTQATGQVGVWPSEDEDDGIDKSKSGEVQSRPYERRKSVHSQKEGSTDEIIHANDISRPKG